MTTTLYRPRKARRRLPRPGLRTVVAVALITSAGAATLDAMTPATPRPVVAMAVASAHEVDAIHAAAAGQPAPRPAAAKAKKHHPLRALLAPLRLVRHVHRFFRIMRNPFSFRRWFW